MPRTRYTAGDGSIERARRLRRDATPAEIRLWSNLRGARFDGHKFRRQQRFGPYTADFVCHAARLVIEIDGDSHGTTEGAAHDARRTSFLEHEGYRVIRFTNSGVLTNMDGVATMIWAALAPSPSHPAPPGGPLPLPHGERSG